MKPEYYSVPNVVLVGSCAIGLDKFNQPIAGTHLWRQDVLDRAIYPDERPHTRKFLEGTTVSLVNAWSHNYFHWLLENLVQLLYLERDKIDHILIPPNPPGYITESLSLLGLSDIAMQWSGIPTEVETLYGFGPVRVDGHNFVDGLVKLRETFSFKRYTETLGQSFEEIYISRQHAEKRRIINEPDLFRSLHHKLKGVVVFAEQLSFQEQVSAFRGAKVIISSHGAGLANMVWAQERCKIVEIFGSYHNPCYEKLAEDLGHEYIRVDGQAVEENILAPLDVLEEVL